MASPQAKPGVGHAAVAKTMTKKESRWLVAPIAMVPTQALSACSASPGAMAKLWKRARIESDETTIASMTIPCVR